MSKNMARLVDEFLCHPEYCHPYSAKYAPMRSLEDSIAISCQSCDCRGKRDPHQYRIPQAVLDRLQDALMAEKRSIGSSASFEDLHDHVSQHCENIRGAGALLAYDVSLRIGQGYLRLEPMNVHLHAGSREGARKLGISGKVAPLSAFPIEMHRLTGAQAEDFLCRFRHRF